ncbi:DNA mismatch repair protein Mlh3-like isoform X1 [Denticeps clupeoides]|uniref:DNA mismatch repair protein Mlh3-like isoform X1 n=1 Tax=Denticeps clupeoides TaxID=299321 RepID=UPI0010A3678F|nr:DNA mismatch repair protein Mlh3-like isoform X1 [Denticeps clupeoides]
MAIKCLSADVQARLRSGIAIFSLQQCVEELLLNSIDAGATCVAVKVDVEAGKVKVLDNGSGIDREDLGNVGKRYHTSKCSCLADLENLRFYGFRGEALASMSTLSALLEISSRTKLSVKTFVKVFDCGKGLDVFEAETTRPSAGTTVVVCNIFHNMPVRRKRLDPVLELDRIRQRVEAVSLLHPSVSFTVKKECAGSMLVQLSKAKSTYYRFVQIHGTGRAQKLGEISYSTGQFEMTGHIGREGHYNSSLQFLYVNKRLLLKTRIHKLLNCLLRKVSGANKPSGSPSISCTTASPKRGGGAELHGVYVVNIKCQYSEYDVCLEPAKTLIEFKDWDAVLSCVEEGVRAFLIKENLVSELLPHDLQQCLVSTGSAEQNYSSARGQADGQCVNGEGSIGTMLSSKPVHRKPAVDFKDKGGLGQTSADEAVRDERQEAHEDESPDEVEYTGEYILEPKTTNEQNVLLMDTTTESQECSLATEASLLATLSVSNANCNPDVFFRDGASHTSANKNTMANNEGSRTSKIDRNGKAESNFLNEHSERKRTILLSRRDQKDTPPPKLALTPEVSPLDRFKQMYGTLTKPKHQSTDIPTSEEHALLLKTEFQDRNSTSASHSCSDFSDCVMAGTNFRTNLTDERTDRLKMLVTDHCASYLVPKSELVDSDSAFNLPPKTSQMMTHHKLSLTSKISSLDKFKRVFGTLAKTKPGSLDVNSNHLPMLSKATGPDKTATHFQRPSSKPGPGTAEDGLLTLSAYTSHSHMSGPSKRSKLTLAAKLSHLNQQQTGENIFGAGGLFNALKNKGDCGNEESYTVAQHTLCPGGNAMDSCCESCETAHILQCADPPDEPVGRSGEDASHSQSRTVTEPQSITGHLMSAEVVDTQEMSTICRATTSSALVTDGFERLVYTGKVKEVAKQERTAKEGTQDSCTSGVANMAVSVLSKKGIEYRCYPFQIAAVGPFLPTSRAERVVSAGAERRTAGDSENPNSLSSQFSEWNNPVFARPPNVALDVTRGQAESLAVKIHNILFPYCFTKDMIHTMKVINQVDKKFLACLIKTEDQETKDYNEPEGSLLVLVDQHAAHERIRLEGLVADSYEEDPENSGQKRLSCSTVSPPLEVSVSEEEIRLLRSCEPLLRRLGLEVEFPQTGKCCVLLGKLPVCFMEKESNELRRGRTSVIMSLAEVSFIVQFCMMCPVNVLSYHLCCSLYFYTLTETRNT